MPDPVTAATPTELPVAAPVAAPVEAPPQADFIDLQTTDGNVIKLKPQEFYNLAQYGYNEFVNRQNKPVESPQTVQSEPITVETLQKDIVSLRQERETERQLTHIQNTLYTESQKNEETRMDKELSDAINVEVLARHNLNPRIPIDSIYPDVFKRYKKVIDKAVEDRIGKIDVNGKVRAHLNSTIRGTGGVPVIDANKTYKPEDILSGASRKALAAALESIHSE